MQENATVGVYTFQNFPLFMAIIFDIIIFFLQENLIASITHHVQLIVGLSMKIWPIYFLAVNIFYIHVYLNSNRLLYIPYAL